MAGSIDIYVSKCGAVVSPTRLPVPAFCPVCGEPLDATAVTISLATTGQNNDQLSADDRAAIALQATTDMEYTTTDAKHSLQETT